MRHYQNYLNNKKNMFGELFDPSDLNPDFIPYFENQKRIEVDFGYEKKRGTVGVSTGRKPVFLLMLRKDSKGSPYIINKNTKIIKEIPTKKTF